MAQQQVLPPTILGPVSALSTSIRIAGAIVGAEVAIYVNGDINNPVAGGTVTSGIQDFPLFGGKTLKGGDQLTATATFNNDTSAQAPNPPLAVLAAPSILSTVTFRFAPAAAGQTVILDGCFPGADVNVHRGATLLGQAVVIGDTSVFVFLGGLTSPLMAGEALTAIQVGGGVQSTPGLSEGATPIPAIDSLPPPTMTTPLYACRSSIQMTGALNGTRITVTRVRNNQTSKQALWFAGEPKSKAWFPLATPLAQGETVQVSQEYPLLFRPVTESQPPVSVLAPSAPDAPKVLGPVCLGATSVDVQGLEPGFNVWIELQRMVSQQGFEVYPLGAGTVPPQTNSFTFPLNPMPGSGNIPPMVGVGPLRITAYEDEVCQGKDIHSDANQEWPNGGDVVDFPSAIPTPALPFPLYQCASMVHVENVTPGASVIVLARWPQQSPLVAAISSSQRVLATSTDIPVVGLTLGEEVSVLEVGCPQAGPVSSSWKAVQPVPQMAVPKIQTPVTIFMQAVTVTDVLPGAQVNVFVNGQYRNGITTATDSAVVFVGQISSGDKITAQMKLCQFVSDQSPPAPVGTGQLQLTVTPASVAVGASTQFNAHTQDQGTLQAVANAAITVGNHVVGHTDPNGNLTFTQTFNQSGPTQVRADASNYKSAYSTITVTGATGYRQVDIYNCSDQGTTVSVWLYDVQAKAFTHVDNLDAQYDDNGICPAQGAQPVTASLATGKDYYIYVVDLAWCAESEGPGADDPDVVSCQRAIVGPFHGDQNGPSAAYSVS